MNMESLHKLINTGLRVELLPGVWRRFMYLSHRIVTTSWHFSAPLRSSDLAGALRGAVQKSPEASEASASASEEAPLFQSRSVGSPKCKPPQKPCRSRQNPSSHQLTLYVKALRGLAAPEIPRPRPPPPESGEKATYVSSHEGHPGNDLPLSAEDKRERQRERERERERKKKRQKREREREILLACGPWEARRRLLEEIRKGRAYAYGALLHAPPELRGDQEVVAAAVKESGFALEFASEALRGNREVVLAAVEQDGRALRYASVALRGDRDFLLVAVEQNADALEFASKALRGDREVVLAAVKVDGTAFRFASEELRTDQTFLLEAVEATRAWWLVELAAEALRADESFVEECKAAAGTGLVFTFYDSYTCSEYMRTLFPTAGASVPGGAAYDRVMEELQRGASYGSPFGRISQGKVSQQVPVFSPSPIEMLERPAINSGAASKDPCASFESCGRMWGRMWGRLRPGGSWILVAPYICRHNHNLLRKLRLRGLISAVAIGVRSTLNPPSRGSETERGLQKCCTKEPHLALPFALPFA